MRAFSPSLLSDMDKLPDRRERRKIIYPAKVFVWVGLLSFLCRLGARRRITFEFGGSSAVVKNFNRIAGLNLSHIPHHDTLAGFLKTLSVRAVFRLRREMVKSLIKTRAIEQFRLFGRYYGIAIDGTGQFSFKERHCEHCLTQKHEDGSVTYYHMVLEAKLVCANGLSISIASEFIENPDDKFTKQDCELNAFYRLLPRLRKDYLMIPMCLLLDSHFLNQNVMRLCREQRVRYIISFKEGSLPSAYSEFLSLIQLVPENVKERITNEGKRQRYRWLNGLEHEGNKFNAIECVESSNEGKENRFVFATDLEVTKENVAALSERGRCRWKIENEGFNTQKNLGYELEHVYCEDPNASKNFYLLLQIAHNISQLMEKGNLLGQTVEKLYGSARAFAQRILEALRNCVILDEFWEQYITTRYQIRLDSS